MVESYGRSAYWCERRALDPLVLVVVTRLIWMLGSSGRAARARLLGHLTSAGLCCLSVFVRISF